MPYIFNNLPMKINLFTRIEYMPKLAEEIIEFLQIHENSK